MNQPQATTRLHFESSTDDADIRNWLPLVGSPAWIILQSYTAVTFETLDATLPPLGDEFAGSIFGPNAEIRWTRSRSSVSVMLFRDVLAPEGDPIELGHRSYFGLGYWSREKGFWEPKLPETPIAYPLLAAEACEGDRPMFMVNEYYAPIPSTLPPDLTPESLEDLVNKPSLIAWRLVSFTAGRS